MSLRNRVVVAASIAAVLAACAPPKPPEEERRPEPQVQARSVITTHADQYKDRARAVGTQQQEAAERQRAEIDAATR